MELKAKIKSQDKYSYEKGEDLINITFNYFYESNGYKSKDITTEDYKEAIFNNAWKPTVIETEMSGFPHREGAASVLIYRQS